MIEWCLNHNSELSLIIEVLSLLVSIVLTIGIYRLESKHEKEKEDADKKAQELAIKETAKVFLIDNDEEVDYLPLSEIASKLNLKRKHNRTITTRFLRCSQQLQDEILKQVNTSQTDISMEQIAVALDELQKDIEGNELGMNILYDGAKYLHRAFERYSNEKIEEINPYCFSNLKTVEYHDTNSKVPWRVITNDSDLLTYMIDYMNLNKDKKSKNEAPIDMVYNICNLGKCSESIMTFWTMRIIIDTCKALYNCYIEFDENLIETQEDMYYYTLLVLYETYLVKEVGHE